jgi:putative spermidine/putrescine transport system substrate-binding protein
MTIALNRRTLLKGSAAGLALAGLPLARAGAAETLVGVEWGGTYIEALQKIQALQDKAEINWELHASGAAAIIAKVKASWPNPQYDFIAAYDPVFTSFIEEDMVETITLDEVPNLKDIPDTFIFKDKQGNLKNIPRSLAGQYFGYRSDIAPKKLETVDDLLDPALKGQICWPHPITMSTLQIVALARHRGGDERNMEPGWEFMKELAKSGNIGRIATTEVEFINSMTTGETSVSFWTQSAWVSVAQNVPVVQLTKAPGFTNYLTTTGFVVLKNRQKKAATLEFLNFCLTPECQKIYSDLTNEAPASSKATPGEDLTGMVYTEAEAKEFTVLPDWSYMGTQVDGWVKRWEQEIAPLL